MLVLLLAACGSDRRADPTVGAPVPTTQADEVPASDADEIQANPVRVDSEPGPDYTDDELEVLLEPTSTDPAVEDAPEPEPLEVGSPEAAIRDIQTKLDDSSTASPVGSGESEILDRVEPLDDAPAGRVIGIREGRRINEAGEANRLDEAAALSCGNVEVALTAVDDGDTGKAADRLRAAASLVADTSVTTMRSWAPILDESAAALDTAAAADADVSPLLAFLDACTQGGYEL